MTFVSILVAASMLVALAQRRTRDAAIDFREIGRFGLIVALAISGISLLVSGGWQVFLAHCTSLECLIAPESDPLWRLLDAVLLIPRSLVPLSAFIVCLEFGWRILAGAETSLMPGEAHSAGGWTLRAVDVLVVIWSAFVADLSGRLRRTIRSMVGKASNWIEIRKKRT